MPTTKLGRARWIAAAVVFLAVTVVVFLSYLPGAGIQSCHNELANNGTTVEICGPIGLSDLVAVMLFLGIAAFLIWPDLSELGIGNLITLKKQVAETKAKTEKAEADIRGLTLAQATPSQDAVTSAVRGLAQATIVGPSDAARSLSSERAAAERELLSLVALLDRFLAILSVEDQGEALRKAHAAGLIRPGSILRQLAALARWQRQFEARLQTWAGIRNQVVHFPERLSDEQIQQGVELGNRLVSSLRRSLDIVDTDRQEANET